MTVLIIGILLSCL